MNWAARTSCFALSVSDRTRSVAPAGGSILITLKKGREVDSRYEGSSGLTDGSLLSTNVDVTPMPSGLFVIGSFLLGDPSFHYKRLF